MTLAPGDVTAADVDAVRAAEVSDGGIEDALAVCFGFNVIDRIADSLGFDCPPPEVHKAYAEQFLAEGYGNETA